MRMFGLSCVVALSTWAATPKLSSPKDIVEALEKSRNVYEINPIESLDVARGRLADEQWKQAAKVIDLPKVNGVRVEPWPAPSNAAAKAMDRAETAFRAKNYADAEKHYRAAIKASPSYYIAHAYLGDSLLFGDKKDVEGALAAYEDAIKLNPNDYRLFFFRASVHRKLGNKQQVVDDLRRALLLKPHNEVLLNMVRNSHGVTGLRAEPDLFVPRAFVRRAEDGKSVQIYADTERIEWLAWANCKALWLGEPSYRKAKGAAGAWSSFEDYECLAHLVTMYVDRRDSKEGVRDDRLDRLEAVAKDGLLDAMVLYEFASRIDPMVMLKVSATQREEVAKFIERYVLTSAEAP